MAHGKTVFLPEALGRIHLYFPSYLEAIQLSRLMAPFFHLQSLQTSFLLSDLHFVPTSSLVVTLPLLL